MINVNKEATGFLRALAFHQAMGLTVREQTNPPTEPTVEERILRAKLLFEETLETIEKGLGLALVIDGLALRQSFENFDFAEDGPYDPIETLDGLADVKVIANGTAVAFGLPMEAADREVFESNMSKLDENGNPTINGVTPGYRTEGMVVGGAPCAELGYDPSKPIGKVLKGARYQPAMIGPLMYDSSTCPGHVGHDENMSICRYCGTHVDEERP